MDHHPENVSPPFYKQAKFYLFAAAGLVAFLFITLLASIVIFRWYNPDFTRFTLREDWSQYEADRYGLREYWVEENEIPEHMKWAVVASEDQLFWEHFGLDIESIKEAWEERETDQRVRGASTISQQVAKNLYLTPAQSFLRKGVEAGITLLIELFWPKERIIEVYLNIAEFGPGIYGIGFASEQYWDIPASDITPEMSARLAAVLPSPKRMRVEPPSPFAEERSVWILRQMTQLSGIAYYQPEEPENIDPEFDDVDPYLLETDFDTEEYLSQEEDDSLESDTTDVSSSVDSLNQPSLPDSLLNAPKADTVSSDSIN